MTIASKAPLNRQTSIDTQMHVAKFDFIIKHINHISYHV